MDETPNDRTVQREDEAAAAEAGRIGGPAPPSEGDEARRPVEEAGGGEAEGFEQSERELVEHASHAENRYSPRRDAFAGEAESDEATAVHGEPDEVDPTEVVRDPEEGEEDPGEGPGLAPSR